MRDLHNNINVKRVISPVSEAGTAALVGQIVDKQGFRSVQYIIATGALASATATFAVTMSEGDDPALSDAAAVAAGDLLGTLSQAGFIFSDDDKCFKIGYKGNKRYTRLTITPAANAAAALISAVAILGDPLTAPTSNPPV